MGKNTQIELVHCYCFKSNWCIRCYFSTGIIFVL